MKYELGIIGAGKMAEAIARAAIAGRVLTPERITAADRSPDRREVFQSALGIRAVEDNREVARSCRAILLSVKPQQMRRVLAEIVPDLNAQTLLISIAAGISTQFIQAQLG